MDDNNDHPTGSSPPTFEFFNNRMVAHSGGRSSSIVVDDDESSQSLVQSVEETTKSTWQSNKSASSSPIPSSSTSSFYQQPTSFPGGLGVGDGTTYNQFNTTNNNNHSSSDTSVSTDQERQVLLLMLLAQVCALHDPTPKTFTIHVIELYERGLLNRDSIDFLFELGLVPSISPSLTNLLLHLTRNHPNNHNNGDNNNSGSSNNDTMKAEACHNSVAEGLSEIPKSDNPTHNVTSTARAQIVNELALIQNTTHVGNHNITNLAAVFAASGDPQRCAEAYAIRATLAQYEHLQRQTKLGTRMKEDDHNNNKNERGPSFLNDPILQQPWDVKHFPLSLSRYQREFVQIKLLASGSFGQVFHAQRKMDGCDYAVKKIDFDAMGYSDEAIQEVVREVECLAKVSDHPNVVRYYTSWLEPSWMTGGQSVELTCPPQSLSSATGGIPSNAPRRPQQGQRLLLNNPFQPMNPENDGVHSHGTYGYPPSESNGDSSRFYPNCGDASIESKEGSSSGMWQRRFSYGSEVDSSDQVWEKYHEQSVETLEQLTFNDNDDESSASVVFMGNARARRQDVPHDRQQKNTGTTSQGRPSYRYQISLFIQMQLCHPASLGDWIRERNANVPETAYAERIGPALEIFEQITKGLAHVHEKGIIHRDLKPANCFVSSDGRVIKIGDFGLSKQLNEIKRTSPQARQTSPAAAKVPAESFSYSPHGEHDGDTDNGDKTIDVPWSTNAITPYTRGSRFFDSVHTSGIGTRSYAAPEQLTTRTYSTAADIFSLGLIFLELICCFETEHERLHNFEQCRQQRGVQRWIMDDYPDLGNIILACTQLDAIKRPSANAILGMLSVRLVHHDMSSIPQASSFTDLSRIHSIPQGSRGDLHNALLRKSIEQRDRELEDHKQQLAEKEREIERLREEMAKLKASLAVESRPSNT